MTTKNTMRLNQTGAELEHLAGEVERTKGALADAELGVRLAGERTERAQLARRDADRAVRVAIADDRALGEIRPLRQLADDAALELGRAEAALLRATGERERAETAVAEAREALAWARRRAEWLPERARELRRKLTRLQRVAGQHAHELKLAQGLVVETEGQLAEVAREFREVTGDELPGRGT